MDDYGFLTIVMSAASLLMIMTSLVTFNTVSSLPATPPMPVLDPFPMAPDIVANNPGQLNNLGYMGR